jgi:DNA sulfur modification protein DndD
MIFRKLEFKDVLTFKGTQVLDFPEHSGAENESSLIVVLSPNSGGKTSVMRLLQFLFYGWDEVDGVGKENQLPSRAALSELEVGGELECWVEAEVYNPNDELETIRRIIEVKKVGNSSIFDIKIEMRLEKIRHTDHGDKWEEDSGGLQARIKNWVPKALFDMFYFKGEELQQSMLGRQQTGVKKGLENLLHEEKWKNAIECLQKTRIRIEKKFKSLNQQSKEYQEKQKLFSGIKSQLEAKENEENDLISTIENGTSRIRDISSKIAEISDENEISQKLSEKILNKENSKRNLEREFIDIEKEISLCISHSQGLPFIGAELVSLSNYLSTLKDKKLLPSEIAEGYLRRLLDEKLCICTRSLDPKANSDECNSIKSLMQDSIESFVSAKLMELYDSVSGNNTSQGYADTIENTVGKLKRLKEKRTKLNVSIDDARLEIKQLEDERINSSADQTIAEKFKKFTDDKRVLESNLSKNKEKLTNLENEINQQKSRLRTVQQSMAGLTSNRDREKFVQYSAAINKTTKLENVLHELLKILKNSFYSILDGYVQGDSDKYVTGSHRCVVDRNTLLPKVTLDGETVGALGGAESQFFAISYVSALARLRMQLHQDLKSFNIHAGNLGKQSFFLDSVFGSSANWYARATASLIPGAAVQSVVFFAEQQWRPAVINELFDHIDRLYLFYHSPGRAETTDERSEEFEVNDERINLIREVVDHPHTEIVKSEIK